MKRFSIASLSQWVGILVLLGVMAVLGFRMSGVQNANNQQQVQALKEAIGRTAVQCYALEGAYPPDIQYLEDHYGLSVDWNRFRVNYVVSGSNLAPTITVAAKTRD